MDNSATTNETATDHNVVPFVTPHTSKFDPAEAMFTPAERAALRKMMAQFGLITSYCPMASKLTAD